MEGVIVNLFLLVFVFYVYKVSKKNFSIPLSHLDIFCVVWIFILLFSQLINQEAFETYNLVLLYSSLISFILGSIIIINKDSDYQFINLKASKYDINVFWTLYVLFIYFNLDKFQDYLTNGISFENLAKNRINRSLFELYGESNILKTVLGDNANLIFPMSLFLYYKKSISSFSFFLISGSIILIFLSSFTRSPFFFLIVMYLFVYSLYKNKINYLRISLLLIPLLVFFVFTNSIINIASNNLTSDNMSDIKTYIFGGISALQNMFKNLYIDNYEYDSKYYSFDFINYILKNLGFIDTYPSLMREYDNIYSTNVYTYLDAFFLDFGHWGCIIGSFALGAICSFVYRRAFIFNDIYFFFLYSNIIYYTAFIFMNNEFIRFSFLLLFVKVFFLVSIKRLLKR